jgi:RHS repeat-associated protein
MKTLRILILGWLVTATIIHAQTESPAGWYSVGGVPSDTTLTLAQPAVVSGIQADDLTQPPPNGPIAETNTPEIQALADGLQDDPLKIYNYVHDHIRYVLYFGSKKGAQLTLLEKSGNDFDQCALLVALLRAAGYLNTGYQFGWMIMPYDNPDGSHRDLHHWLGLTLNNNSGSWSYTTGYLDCLLRTWRFYPLTRHDWGNNLYAFQREWVTLTINSTNYYLDPAFKVSEPVTGINLPSAMGFSSNAMMNAAQGLATGDYVTNLNEAAIQGLMTTYTTNLLGYIQGNCPNASLEQVWGGQSIVPATNTTLSTGLLFATTNMNGTMPIISWVNQPTNMMSTIGITFAGINYSCYIPKLLGQRLSLTINSSGTAQLWQDDTLLATGSTGGGSGSTTLGLSARHPAFHGGWDTTNNLFIPADPADSYAGPTYASYKNANANYAILYSFEPDWGWLQQRQQKLDAYRQQGYPDTSRQVLTETLNIMGLNWELQDETFEKMIAQQIGVLPQHAHRMGRMAQESGHGYYVDIYKDIQSCCSSGGSADGPCCDPYMQKHSDLSCFFLSAMEHGLIEQLQSTNLVAASSAKMLELANANHQAVYLVTSTNWAAVQSKLVNYNTNDLASLVNPGNIIFLPQNGDFPVNGTGSWSGYGFMVRFAGGAQMLIGQGVFGGYVSDSSATVSPSWIDYSSYSQPLYFSSSPVSVPNITGADPVNMADGTFQVQATDLSLGQTEPRGLSFSRYYSSSRRNSNLAGIAPGWIHNYYLNAATISSPQAGLGGSTPAQAAPMLAAMIAAINLFDGPQHQPKNWLVTTLIAKWGIDQLTAKAVSITMGKDTVQFIKQPDGSFTPPANCTMTLTQATTNSPYVLQERHGRTFKFNASGWGTNIADPYNQSLKLAYNTSNWVTTATDWKGRTLTFNYSTTSPKRLISVADSTGRSVSLGYSSSNDLTSVSDPESKTNKFLYDTNHQITATFDALGQLVASNIYNGFGRVTTQFTQGNTNKTWKIFWSGWQTVSQDPAGGQESFVYDDNTRLIAQQDALGNLTRKCYDGQDHVVMTVSPLGETNQFIYDGNNNLRYLIDPLNYTNQLFYDGQNNLVRTLDALNNPSTFGYNTNFSLTGKTNGAGDWVNYSFNSDGTLHTRADSGGTNTYAYDSTYGQLNSITYPNSLGNETFITSAQGDVTSHTDARGFATAYQYNLRRQLTNSIATNNLVKRIAYDAVGNVASSTDGRAFGTTNIWSATRKLLATKLPATPQGTPCVTNIYDNRDWLARTLDPLQKAVQLTNDSDGHLIAATDPLLQTVHLGYDADGQTLATTNAAGEVTQQQWDVRGKLVKLTDGAGHVIASGYDAAGNQILLTNRNGKVWQFQFDGANRLITTISPLNRQTVQTWNHQGLLATITDPANQLTTFGYDARGRLTNRTDNVATNLFSYDANNNLTGATNVGQALCLSLAYDAYNRASSCTDTYGNVIQYRYDANNNLTNLVYPGGKNVYYAYDSLNRLTNVTDWSGRKSSYAYDLASHLTSVTRPNGSYRTIGYDAAGQMTNILEQMANSLPIAWFRFNWTNSGNMAWEFAAPLPHSTTVPTRTMTYDDDNRLSQFQGPSMGSSQSVGTDADGNITSAPLTNDTFVTYAFDARNRLQNVGGVTNTYDAINNRVGQTYGTNSTIYVVNPNTRLPQVLMRIKNSVTNYYIYGAGLLYQITETATKTNTLTYHYDYRGSTIALSADNGLVTDRIEYSAYGLTTYRAGTNDTPFLFNGKYGVQTDASGLLYMQARYYNPYLCRFVSADPSGFAGGLNHYAYANGNPVSYLDPFGMGAVGESSVDPSWFNAPTAEQTEVQNMLAGFVNFATLGAANLVSSAISGTDLMGNNLNVGDAYQQTLESAVFVSSLALSLPTDGASIELEEAVEGGVGTVTEGTALREGSFSIADWSGYPASVPKPTGPFNLLEGAEYDTARSAANNANRALHQVDSSLNGLQLHEIQPVKFGGSPIDPLNKIPLTPQQHATVTTWWNQLQHVITP